MSDKVLAGFDLGGTKLSLTLAVQEGPELVRLREDPALTTGEFTPYRDGVAYLGIGRQMVRMLKEALEEASLPQERLGAIGIGTAGPLAAELGALKDPGNIKPQGMPEGKTLYIPLVEVLKEEFKVPVAMANDCLAGVLGEVYHGVGREVADKSKLFLVYITLSTGFGGGVWDGGHLLRGKDGNAAEVGHIVVKEGGLKCGCGNYGCAEAYCSGRGIAKNAKMKLLNEDLKPKGDYGTRLWELAKHELTNIDAPLVFKAAAEGDRLAQEVIDEAAHYGGLAFAAIANAYDPETITVGGALALAHPELVERIAGEMRNHLNVAPPRVMLTPLGERAVECGALVLAAEALTARPRLS